MPKLTIEINAVDKAGGVIQSVTADLGDLGQSAERSGKNIERSATFFTEMSSAVNLAKQGWGALQQVMAVTVDAAAQEQRVMAQTEAVIRSTGAAAGFSAQQMFEMAGALQQTTGKADDAILSMQNVLLTFTQIKGPEFQGATQAVLDMSAALGMDLQGAAIQVGKALNDPILGVTALGRAGVQFNATQKEMIRNLVEMGDVAGAQRIILQELNTQFGGSAAAQLNTYAGQVELLKNNVGDLGEAVGKRLLPGLTDTVGEFNALALTLNDMERSVSWEGLGRLAEALGDVAVRASPATFAVEGTTRRVLELLNLTDPVVDRAREMGKALREEIAEPMREVAGRSPAMVAAIRDFNIAVGEGMPDRARFRDDLLTTADVMEARMAKAAGEAATRLDALHASMKPFTLTAENAAEGVFNLAEQFGIGVGVLEGFAQQQGLVVPETVALNDAMEKLAGVTGEFADFKQAAGLQAIAGAVREGTEPAVALNEAINDANYNLGLLAPAWTGATSAIAASAPSAQQSVDNLGVSIQSADDYLGKFREKWDSLDSKSITLTVNAPPGVPTTLPGGRAPLGGQHGLDMIVPPGFPADTFPLRATSGERVTITPAGQERSARPLTVHNTFIVNDPIDWEVAARRVVDIIQARR